MNTFFTSFIGWHSLKERKALEHKFDLEKFGDAWGFIGTKTLYGIKRDSAFSFPEFSFVDGWLWTAAALKKFLNVDSFKSRPVIPVLYHRKYYFGVRQGVSWVLVRPAEITYNDWTAFLRCPRITQVVPRAISETERFDFQRWLEKNKPGCFKSCLAGARSLGGV